MRSLRNGARGLIWLVLGMFRLAIMSCCRLGGCFKAMVFMGIWSKKRAVVKWFVGKIDLYTQYLLEDAGSERRWMIWTLVCSLLFMRAGSLSFVIHRGTILVVLWLWQMLLAASAYIASLSIQQCMCLLVHLGLIQIIPKPVGSNSSVMDLKTQNCCKK